MANITELQLQGDSTVHKLNDSRITTTAVTTATHILTTNSDVTSIAPITAANLASVLGGMQDLGRIENIDLNLIDENSVYLLDNRQGGCSNVPAGFKSMSVLITYKALNKYSCVQTMIYTQENAGEIHYRYKWDKSWGNWINIPSFYNNYPDIASLASALGGSLKELLVRNFEHETCKTWGTGLYFLFGEGGNSYRYALVHVAHSSSGYAVIPIGDTADFGTDVQNHNLLYQINSDGVKFRAGSTLPCYIKKLM